MHFDYRHPDISSPGFTSFYHGDKKRSIWIYHNECKIDFMYYHGDKYRYESE